MKKTMAINELIGALDKILNDDGPRIIAIDDACKSIEEIEENAGVRSLNAYMLRRELKKRGLSGE